MKAARRTQAGLTLVIALVMLVVLSLLVVSAIRFGNINLRITGNVQASTEAEAAAQRAIETTIAQMIAAEDMSTIAAQENLAMSSGAQTYTVDVEKPACIFTKAITNVELDPSKEDDLNCYENPDTEKSETADNKLTTAPTGCKNQQWNVRASVDDGFTGAKVSILQGVATRVAAKVQCP